MSQDDLYREASTAYGPALQRLARAYEVDADRRKDLLQDIHLALWRSFEGFEGRCSIRTWVYRIAHNAAASYVLQQRRRYSREEVSLREIEDASDPTDTETGASQRIALDRLMALIHRLKPFDRQLMLLYLEGMDATEISEITGISPGNVRIQLHRMRAILGRRFHKDGTT